MIYSEEGNFIFNEYQTPLTKELIDSLPRDVFINLIEYLNSVPFIASLISPDMKSVAELPKDSNGKIIVNVTEPHRLENIDYFREAAIHFKEYGKYTLLTPNPHPNSPYRMFWREEKRRCLEGMVRPDGEWIPGDLYFYWNYCPMLIVEQIKGTKRGKRVKDFPKPWLGDYLFFHYKDQAELLGKHVAVIKQRGIGWSYKGSSFGPKRCILMKDQKTFYTAYEKEYLVKDGVLNKAWSYMDFLAQNTPWPRMRLVDSINKMELKIGYKDMIDGTEKGTLSSIIGISSKDDQDKIRGKRGTIFFEEFGKFPKLSDTWNVCRDSVEDGGIAFDTLVSGGTGGTEDADFEGAEDMIYNPDSYNIYSLPNVFDKNAVGNVIFHWGSYLNRNLCYDSNGMPDVIKALIEVLTEFDKLKKSSSNSRALTQRRAEKCITIQDAVMRTEGTIFPVLELKDYLESVRVQGSGFFKSHYIGDLISTSDSKIKWNTSDKFPIRKYRLEASDDKIGSIEIYEMPKKDSEGVIRKRYIAGIDPYDDDSGTSLGSIFIFDTFNQCIVAEYTGRPKFAEDFFEICRKLLIFYSAEACYESNKKGLFTYFSQKNCIYLLSDNPSILVDKEMMKGNQYGNKSKGVHATNEINSWARRLQRDWLLKDASGVFQEYNEEGDQITNKLNLHTIRSVPYLEELIAWNGDINCDRVSAMGMCLILNEEYKKYNQIFQQKEPEKDFASSKYFEQYTRNAFSYGRS